MRFLRSTRHAMIAIVAVLQLSSCATFSLEGGDTGSNTVTRRTEVVYLYGLAGQPDMRNLCGQNLPPGTQANKALATVKVKTNLLYMLCATITLGMIQPLDIEYTCAVPCVNEH
jgi:hypothetical protein